MSKGYANGSITARRGSLGWPSQSNAEMDVVRRYQSRWGRTRSWWRYRRAVRRGVVHDPQAYVPLLVFRFPWTSRDVVNATAACALVAITILALVLTAAVIAEVFT